MIFSMTISKQLTLPGLTVKKSNEFVRSKLRLDDAVMARIFTSVIACIRPDDKDFQNYSLPVDTIFNASDTGGSQYHLIRKAIKNITGYVVEMPLSDDENEPDFAFYPLFSKGEYKKGTITAQVHPDLKPHFINLAKNFTSYNLFDYLFLGSTYSQRLFEILNSYEKTHPSIEIPLDKLHFMLNTPESFQKRFPDFRRYVLERAHKEITKKTRLEYEWKPEKKGRSVDAVLFIFSKKVIEKQKEVEKKKDHKKEIGKQKKYIPQALECFKSMGSENFLNGRCPKENKKTQQCVYCAKLGYFLT